MGASSQLTTAHGWTCLHYACHAGSLKAAEYFLSLSDLDVNAKARDGDTPVMKAAQSGNADLLRFLIDSAADYRQLNKVHCV